MRHARGNDGNGTNEQVVGDISEQWAVGPATEAESEMRWWQASSAKSENDADAKVRNAKAEGAPMAVMNNTAEEEEAEVEVEEINHPNMSEQSAEEDLHSTDVRWVKGVRTKMAKNTQYPIEHQQQQAHRRYKQHKIERHFRRQEQRRTLHNSREHVLQAEGTQPKRHHRVHSRLCSHVKHVGGQQMEEQQHHHKQHRKRAKFLRNSHNSIHSGHLQHKHRRHEHKFHSRVSVEPQILQFGEQNQQQLLGMEVKSATSDDDEFPSMHFEDADASDWQYQQDETNIGEESRWHADASQTNRTEGRPEDAPQSMLLKNFSFTKLPQELEKLRPKEQHMVSTAHKLNQQQNPKHQMHAERQSKRLKVASTQATYALPLTSFDGLPLTPTHATDNYAPLHIGSNRWQSIAADIDLQAAARSGRHRGRHVTLPTLMQPHASRNSYNIGGGGKVFRSLPDTEDFNYEQHVHRMLAAAPQRHWPVKREAIVEGDVILGGLMMVHSREDTIMCGPIMPQGGIQALEAMLYTIDRINEASLLPNITLGAHILDDCDKDSYGLEMAVDFIK
ncbi:involucrin-like, partial [Rhagoletis pomonella]|uniref:involucrin-like n=1 Tax=Rhagoletis pomonella TaxID=28610 RepID=UPI0017815035